MQYTAEEKGKQKAVPQASYQPIGDSQEARELEESLLLSRLQVAGTSSRKMLATNDPNMPGGEPPLAIHSTPSAASRELLTVSLMCWQSRASRAAEALRTCCRLLSQSGLLSHCWVGITQHIWPLSMYLSLH